MRWLGVINLTRENLQITKTFHLFKHWSVSSKTLQCDFSTFIVNFHHLEQLHANLFKIDVSLQNEVPKRKGQNDKEKNTVGGENMIMTVLNKVVRSNYVYGIWLCVCKLKAKTLKGSENEISSCSLPFGVLALYALSHTWYFTCSPVRSWWSDRGTAKRSRMWQRISIHCHKRDHLAFYLLALLHARWIEACGRSARVVGG